MSSATTIAVAVLAVLCAIMLLVDYFRGSRRRAKIGIIVLFVFLLALYVLTGFPIPENRLSFGGTIPIWWAVVAMFIGVILGMIAQYVWTKPKKFTWLDFLRPIVISPMVMLPLIGSLQSTPLETIQLFSLALLAFQNGYFWQQVLKDAKPTQVS